MNRNKLKEELDNYIGSTKCEGAFYINGKWGTGKTYFIKNYQDELNNNSDDKYIQYCTYLSLFGMNNISELETKTIGHKPIKEALTKVIILDDLERCRIDIQAVFAFINRLIENYRIRVILIGNDEEVVRYLQSSSVFNNKLLAAIISEDLDKYKQNLKDLPVDPLLYHSIREKTICENALFEFDANTFFESIINEYDEKTNNLIKRNKAIIIDIINRYQCTNLRTCKASVDNYLKVTSRIEKANKRSINKIVRKNILLASFIYTINHKKGNIHFIYGGPSASDNVLPMDGIQKYITKLIWDEKQIANDIASIKNFKQQSKASDTRNVIKKLNEYWAFKTDEELTSEVEELVKMIKDNTLSLKYYYKALLIVVTYYDYGFDVFISTEELVNYMKKNIETSTERIDVEKEQLLSSFPEDALKYKAMLTAAFKERSIDRSKDDATELLMAMDEKSIDRLSKLSNEFRENRCFFSLVDAEELFEKIKKATSQEIICLRSCISHIYSFSNLYDFFSDDYSNVYKLKEMLEAYDFRLNRIKNKTIEWLIADLKRYLTQLKDPSLNW